MITQKQKIFEFLLRKAEGKEKFIWRDGIAKLIKAELKISLASASHYLGQLEEIGLLSRGYPDVYNGSGHPPVTQVEFWATEFPIVKKLPRSPKLRKTTAEIPSVVLESPVVEKIAKTDGAIISSKTNPTELPAKEHITVPTVQAQLVAQAEEEKPLVAVLVDFDNAVSRARDAGYTLSFLRFREYVRRYGRPEFVEVFLSPMSDRPDIKRMLWKSAYFVVACPMHNKDKDAVDEIIKDRARHLATLKDIATIVIVSEDADFSEGDFPESLRDKGKRVEFVRMSEHRAELEGQNIALRPLAEDAEKKKFSDVLRRKTSFRPLRDPADQRNGEFLDDILLTAIRFYASNHRPRFIGFKALEGALQRSILPRWQKIFHPRNLRVALQALISERVIQQQYGNEFTYYELNPNHPLVLRTMREEQTANTHAANTK